MPKSVTFQPIERNGRTFVVPLCKSCRKRIGPWRIAGHCRCRGRVLTSQAMKVLALALLLAGCSTIAGPIGEYQGTFSCKGKGTITGTGQQSLTVVGGGAGQNTFSLVVDCGEGLTITRERSRSDAITITNEPKK